MKKYLYEVTKGNLYQWNAVEREYGIILSKTLDIQEIVENFQEIKKHFFKDNTEIKLRDFSIFYLPAVTLNTEHYEYMYAFNYQRNNVCYIVSPIEIH